jgi:hypothetical protein
MKAIRFLLPLACLALAGCFESENALLLDVSKGTSPLADGDYIRDDEKKTTISLTAKGDGWYRFVEDGEAEDVFVSELDPASEGVYAVAVANDGCASKPGECNWDYSVIRTSGERVEEIRPDCKLDWDLVADSVSGHTDEVCYFKSASALNSALIAVNEKGRVGDTYQRP